MLILKGKHGIFAFCCEMCEGNQKVQISTSKVNKSGRSGTTWWLYVIILHIWKLLRDVDLKSSYCSKKTHNCMWW